MSTVRDIVDRVYREGLYAPDDQPTRAPLTAAVTAAGTAWAIDTALLSPEEMDLYAEGVLVEADRELALVTLADSAGNLTVRRGVAGTTAVAHDSGTLVYAAPAYPRQAVVDAVCDNVVALFPSVYRLVTTPVTSQSTPLAVPADVVTLVGFSYTTASGVYADAPVALLNPYPDSATGRAIIFQGVAPGKAGHLTYRARFSRPTSEDDDLVDFGVETWWERIIVVGAAAQVIGGRELDATTQEFLAEQFRAQGYPVGSASRQRNELLRVYALMLEQARRNQIAQHPEVVSMSTVSLGAW